LIICGHTQRPQHADEVLKRALDLFAPACRKFRMQQNRAHGGADVAVACQKCLRAHLDGVGAERIGEVADEAAAELEGNEVGGAGVFGQDVEELLALLFAAVWKENRLVAAQPESAFPASDATASCARR
jgi:hypothetical protein